MPVKMNELRVAAGAASSSDIYLHLQAKRAGKLKGEAVTPDHVDDIVVRSWRWGVNATAAIGSVQATGRRSYSGLTIVKSIDSATTPIMAALATNDEIKEARLTMRKSGEGQIDYFLITLKGARISQVEHHVDASGEALETMTIVFTKLDVEYRPQKATGGRGGAMTFSDEILPA